MIIVTAARDGRTSDPEDGRAPDPEDLFELPAIYDDTVVLDRKRRTPVAKLEFADCSDVLDRRLADRTTAEAYIAEALRAPQRVPDAESVMKDVDFAALDALTPLQAAMVEAFLNPWKTDGFVIDLWGGARGLGFALEAFVEYCHVMGISDVELALPVLGDRYVRPRPDVGRLLELVRTAPEPDYAEAVAAASRLRREEPSAVARALTTYLFPGRPEWFWADLVAAGKGRLAPTALLPSVSTVEQASALTELIRELPQWEWNGDRTIERTFVTVAGTEALPFLTAWCDVGHQCTPPQSGRPQPCQIHRRCLDLISRIPTAAAMMALVERLGPDGTDDEHGVDEYLQAAIRRFPHRALLVMSGTDVAAGVAAGVAEGALAEAAQQVLATEAVESAADLLAVAANQSLGTTLRLLLDGPQSEKTSRLLTMAVLADPGFATSDAAGLSPQALEWVEARVADDPSAAEPADLPEILAAPPWRDKKHKRAKPVVVEGLTPPTVVEAAWLPGAREAWRTAHGAGWTPEQGWTAVLPEILDGTGDEHLATYFAAYAPEELVRPQLPDWHPPIRQATDRARTFLAKYELLALPTVLSMTRFPVVRARLLLPFVSTEIAAIMADGLVRLPSVRDHAIEWLRRHPEDAVRSLVPTALGKPGKLRQNTVAALRWMQADGGDVVTIAQQAYGEDVAAVAKEVLAVRSLDSYPKSVPSVPLWARPALLSPIRLKDSRIPLPHSAVQAVVEMLMFSELDALYPGLDIVNEVCDASSLVEFAGSLAESWDQSGGDQDDRWVIGALGVFGDASTVPLLEKLMRGWNRQAKADNVSDGLDALAMIGGDQALTVLYQFSRNSWNASDNRKARAAFENVAKSMDLTADRLADRLAPTSGLTDEGVELDYGRRRFSVSFDELLRPVVTDESGAVLKALPKPGKRDDAELAAASHAWFATLKKQARDGAREQAGRLEKAMFQRRRWLPGEFSAYVVGHLVLGRLARRLVWGVYAEDDRLLGAFRVAEDRSFADVDDACYEIPEGARVGVAHPVDLGVDLARWSEVFSDYEILQPFEQLGRAPLILTAEELAGKCLVRPSISPEAGAHTRAVHEVRFGPMKFEALVSRGWQRGPVGADRLWSRLLRPVGDGIWVVMELLPGLEAGAAQVSAYQAITAVWLSATGDDPDFERHALPLARLDAVTASVVLRDQAEVHEA